MTLRHFKKTNIFSPFRPAFYLTFWQLSEYELSPPAASYEEYSNKLRTLSREEDTNYSAAERSSDRAKRRTAQDHRDKRNRLNHFIDILGHELKDQTAVRAFTLKRLAREKQHWFAHSMYNSIVYPHKKTHFFADPRTLHVSNAFVEHCLHPRALMSPMDADYCAQMIKVIHLQGTPGFWTLMTYDKVLGDHVKVMIFTCTGYEARNYGTHYVSLPSIMLHISA